MFYSLFSLLSSHQVSVCVCVPECISTKEINPIKLINKTIKLYIHIFFCKILYNANIKHGRRVFTRLKPGIVLEFFCADIVI